MFSWLNWFSTTQKFADATQQTAETQLRNVGSIGSRQAGVRVDEKTALTLTSCYAAIRCISETLSTLPLPVYQSLSTGGKQRERNHPNTAILNESPDGIISAVAWKEAKLAHVLTFGNAFSEIEKTNGGDVLACHLLDPKKVKPERTKAGQIEYKVQGSYVPIPAHRMLHFAGLGYDGVQGYSPIKLAQRAIGLGLATEAFGSAFFNNGSKGGGIITHPGKLSATARSNIINSIDEIHNGPDNFGKWMLFEEGVGVNDTTIPPEEAQFLETRGFQVTETARLYRIPPHMIGDLSHATFSNIEEQGLDFVTHTIRPWAVRLETEINRKMFTKADRDAGYFAEFLVDGLLRGKIAERYAAYAIGRQWGWLCVDDIHELENMNPLPNGQGKIYLSPLNMVDSATLGKEAEPVTPAEATPAVETTTTDPAEATVTDVQAQSLNGAQTTALLDIVNQCSSGLIPPETAKGLIAAANPGMTAQQIDAIINPLASFTPKAPEQPAPAPQPPNQDAIKSSRDCVKDNVERMIRRECEAIRHAATKPDQFLRLVDHFYSGHRTICQRAIAPSVKAYSDVISEEVSSSIICDQLMSGHAELLDLSGTVAADQLPATVEAWLVAREQRSEEIVSSL